MDGTKQGTSPDVTNRINSQQIPLQHLAVPDWEASDPSRFWKNRPHRFYQEMDAVARM